MPQKILVIPKSRHTKVVRIREDGTAESRDAIEGDDGNAIDAVSDVIVGVPDEEDESTPLASRRVALAANFSAAAQAAVKARLAAAAFSDALPANWKAKKGNL